MMYRYYRKALLDLCTQIHYALLYTCMGMVHNQAKPDEQVKKTLLVRTKLYQYNPHLRIRTPPASLMVSISTTCGELCLVL